MATLHDTLRLWFQVREYDHKREQRAVKHKHLGERNNATVCRSPTRELDTRWVKNELQRKRQQEFSKRRPKNHNSGLLVTAEARDNNPRQALLAQECVTQMFTSARRPLMMTQGIGIPSGDVNSTEQASRSARVASQSDQNQPSTMKQAGVSPILSPPRDQAQTRRKAPTTGERAILRDIIQLNSNHMTQQTASIQTEPGSVTVKEGDVLQLAEYLQEALRREEALRTKLVTLQRSTSTLLRSSELLWKTRCDEDLLKNKIKALESQLQVCMKRVPRDGVEELMRQTERQKEAYEEKALGAVQRAAEEKTEAESKTEILGVALQAAEAESTRWQSLCEELRESSSQLRRSQDLSTEQLLQLQNQLERSRGQEVWLREQCESLQQDGADLHSSVALLEEDNQVLREQLQEMRDPRHETLLNYTTPVFASEEGPALEQLPWGEDQVGHQLRETEQRLRMKEGECVELHAELEALEQECRSLQSRLTQCREELRQLSSRRSNSSKRCCGSQLGLCLLLLVLVMVVVAAALWVYHPPVREQLRNVYTALEQRMEEYLMQAASSQHPTCFRPI